MASGGLLLVRVDTQFTPNIQVAVRSGPLCATICHIDSFNQQSYIFSLNAYALRSYTIRKGEEIGTNFML